MDDKIIQDKIERSLEILCNLYRENLITDAYIIGSVAKGTSRKESDIDMLLINPSFEVNMEDLNPDEELENIKKVIDKLKDMDVQFKMITKEKEFIFNFWYQLYKGELFHIMPQKYFFNSLPHIRIPKDLCQNQ
jgi:predicted nucleotidyltransferase